MPRPMSIIVLWLKHFQFFLVHTTHLGTFGKLHNHLDITNEFSQLAHTLILFISITTVMMVFFIIFLFGDFYMVWRRLGTIIFIFGVRVVTFRNNFRLFLGTNILSWRVRQCSVLSHFGLISFNAEILDVLNFLIAILFCNHNFRNNWFNLIRVFKNISFRERLLLIQNNFLEVDFFSLDRFLNLLQLFLVQISFNTTS